MKTVQRSLCVFLVFAAASALVYAGGGQAGKTAAGAKDGNVMRIWFAQVLNGIDGDNKPQAEWFITKLFRDFERANPGVTIVEEYMEDQQMGQTRLKAAVLSGDAPDLINVYSGSIPIGLDDVLMDIGPLIPAADKEIISGWGMVSNEKPSGTVIYGYPIGGLELGHIFYNKALVAKAGLDLTGPGKPRSAREFIAALKKIKDSGVLPIAASDWNTGAIFSFSFGSWWVQQAGLARITSNSMAQTKFSDDTALLEALQLSQDIYKSGYINENYLTEENAGDIFLNGGAAMNIGFNGDPDFIQKAANNGIEAGLYVVPPVRANVKYPNTQIGGAGQAMVVLRKARDPQMAVKFLSFINNKQNTIDTIKNCGRMPLRSDVTAGDLGWAGREIPEAMLKIAQENELYWLDNAMQMDVANEYYKLTGAVIANQMTPKEYAAQMDARAAEIAAAGR